MPNLSDGFPSKWITKKDLNNEGKEDTVLTITGGTNEMLGQGEKAEKKTVLWFEETDKGFVISAKCNYQRIAEMYHTENTDELRGKQITLYFNPDVTFGGKTTGGIRVRAQAPDDEAPF